MNRTPFAIFAMLLLVAASIGLAACGGGDDDDTADDAASEQTSAAADDTSPAEEATADDEEATTAAAAATQAASGGITASDACDLLTQSEVAEALGESVQEPQGLEVLDAPMPGGGTAAVGGCSYLSESFASSISVTYWTAPGSENAIQQMIGLACQGKESISGLGDEACWYDEQHAQIQLAKGGYFLDMFATMSGDASDVLLTLAEKAADKM